MAINRNLKRIQELEALLQRSASSQDEIDTLAELAWELRISQPERAETTAKKAIELAQSGEFVTTPFQTGLATGLVALASVEFQNGLIEEGVKKCLQALDLLENLPSSKTNARIWTTLSWNSFFLGDYPSAQEQALKALDISNQINLIIEKAWALDAIASTYGISKDFPNALQAHREAVQTFQELNDVDGTIRATNNMAMTLYMMEDFTTALACAQQSLQVVQQWNRKYDELNIACTMAQILIDMGRLDDANGFLERAYSGAKDVRNTPIYHVFVLMEWARISLKCNDLEAAKSKLFMALEFAERNNQQIEKGQCHKNLADIYEREGNYRKSLEHLKTFLSIHEEAVGERAAIRMSILTITHQIESARQKAEIYRLQAEQLRNEMELEKRTKELFEELSRVDGLTGLANRRHFDERLEREYARHSRTGSELSLILLDIDHFKIFNDTYGHPKGDECLKKVSQAVKDNVSRSTDLVARYGGEEFICILPETNEKAAAKIAEGIRQAVFDLAIPHKTSLTAKYVTVSLGVVTALCHQKGVPAVLIERADHQLYKAKASGRNRVASVISGTHRLKDQQE